MKIKKDKRNQIADKRTNKKYTHIKETRNDKVSMIRTTARTSENRKMMRDIKTKKRQ